MAMDASLDDWQLAFSCCSRCWSRRAVGTRRSGRGRSAPLGQNRPRARDQCRRPGARHAARSAVHRRRRDRPDHASRIEVPKITLETALPASRQWHGIRLIGQASGAQDRCAGAQLGTGAGHLGPEYLDRRHHDQSIARPRRSWCARCTFAFPARPSNRATSAWKSPRMPATRFAGAQPLSARTASACASGPRATIPPWPTTSSRETRTPACGRCAARPTRDDAISAFTTTSSPRTAPASSPATFRCWSNATISSTP